MNTQILGVINSAITEKVLPSIQNVLGVQNSESDASRDTQSGRLNRSPEDHFGHMDHQSQRLKEGLREYFNSVDHWSNGLNNKGRRDQSCHTTHRSRGLDRDLRVCSGQTDHQSNRPHNNSGEQYDQADYRSPGPDKGSKCYSGALSHRSTRPDNSSGEHLGPQDQQNSMKASTKFSSHRGLNREISTDSQTSEQDCDMVTGANHTPIRFLSSLPDVPCNPKNPCKIQKTFMANPWTPPNRSQVPRYRTPLPIPSIDLLTYW